MRDTVWFTIHSPIEKSIACTKTSGVIPRGVNAKTPTRAGYRGSLIRKYPSGKLLLTMDIPEDRYCQLS
jgi:hypothetical protein